MFSRFFLRSMGLASLLLMPTVFCKTKRQVYIWGNGFYQARPDAILQFHNFVPKKVEGLPQNLVKLVFGEYYQGGIDEKGQLFLWDKKNIDSNYDEKVPDNKRQNITLIQKDVQDVKFTSGYIWILTTNNKVFQYPIMKTFDSNKQITGVKLGQKREVDPLTDTVQLQTGNDHVIALKKDGCVYAMGDDTYGQCGQADQDRSTCPPFSEKRIKYPAKVKHINRIVKIASGNNHNLALDEGGNLFGWGSNSTMQLSHEEQFSKMNNPLICTYTPLRIAKGLDNSKIKQIIAGEDFSIINTENRNNQSCQVFSFGVNLRGQLGIQEIRHLKDISRIQNLSNFVKKIKGEEKKVSVKQLRCGRSHCIALLNIGYIMQWGDNEYGQMGNKKRSPVLSPIILRDFNEEKKKIIGVFAGDNASGVIVDVQD